MIRKVQRTRKCILVADDDADDRELIKVAFEESGAEAELHFVENGEELMYYLNRHGKYSDEEKYPFPNIILLDLNMPRKDGREALREIKEHINLKWVPIIILTTSTEAKDITKCYELGVNSYSIKPANFSDLVAFTRMLHTYWFTVVQLP
ncbi:Response regulator receiver domain-containing protein [Chitinophaga sp. CF118]|uniref:response regulator n=1 Tax=Chitinophaga sp. CF118 TaxID=1884367 RepID=UPI0008EA76A3|nr:response regulator [Chitinophaga sp. CF118]SFD18474.1 Response regulator receiver domain-containing protein [Chitinophaga sp. CF118]